MRLWMFLQIEEIIHKTTVTFFRSQLKPSDLSLNLMSVYNEIYIYMTIDILNIQLSSKTTDRTLIQKIGGRDQVWVSSQPLDFLPHPSSSTTHQPNLRQKIWAKHENCVAEKPSVAASLVPKA
jgi:hypothetical protein